MNPLQWTLWRRHNGCPVVPCLKVRFMKFSLNASVLMLSLGLASAAMAQPAAVTPPVTTSSGLVYQSLKDGTGASPAAFRRDRGTASR